MAMSKKDYVAIAKIINGGLPAAKPEFLSPEGLAREAAVKNVAANLANYFASDNPKFQRGRFLAACGVL